MPNEIPTGDQKAVASTTTDGTHPHSPASASTVDPNRTTDISASSDGPVSLPSLPGYDIIAEIGRGGMGVVYEARQTALNRLVALKMIRAAAGASSAEVARFLAEAEAVAAIRHPNVVQVFDSGRHDGQPYMALEFLSGGTLGGSLHANGRFEPPVAAELLAKIATGVQAAHEQGIVHRDLKPGNVLFTEAGEPKVADFGIAHRAASDMTATGAVIGTPHYMAPEQAAGQAKFVGPAADIYALGVILFECLTGTVPFTGEDVWSVIRQVVSEPPPRPRKLAPTTPRDLELICLKCLAKEPHERYGSAAELADDLRRFLDGMPVTARPLGVISRAWRAVKRNPVMAGAVVAVVSSLSIGLGIALVKADEAETEAEKAKQALTERDDKEKQRAVADAARAAADAAEKLATAEALRNSRMALYSREVSDARRWLGEGNVPKAEEALEACPPDLRGWEWRFTKRWLDRRTPFLPPVTGPFTPSCVAVSPDSRWVAVGGVEFDDRTGEAQPPSFVWLWDLRAGGPPVKLPGKFFGPVAMISFDRDSRLLAAIAGKALDASATLQVWDVADPASPVVEAKPDPPFLPVAIRITPGAVTAVMACRAPGSPTKLKTWSLQKKDEPTELEFGGKDGVTCAAFAPGGTRLVLVGVRADVPAFPDSPQFARMFQTDGEPIGQPIEVDPNVRVVAFAPFGPNERGVVFGIATADGFDGALAAWDGESAKINRRVSLGAALITGLQVRGDGKVMPTARENGYAIPLRVWNPATGDLEVVARFPMPRGVACFPDGRRLAVGDYTGLRLWNPVDYHDRAFGTAADPAHRFALLSGDRLAMWSMTNFQGAGQPHVRVGKPDGGLFATITPEPAAHGYLAGARVGEKLALWADLGFEKPSQVLLCDPAAGAVVHRWPMPANVYLGSLAGDATGTRLAVARPNFDPNATPEDRGVKIYNTVTGKLERALPLQKTDTFPTGLSFSRSGKYLAAARSGGQSGVPGRVEVAPGGVTVWDIETGAVVMATENIPGGAIGIAFSPDGSLLAAGGSGSRVRLWRTDDWTLRELPMPSGGTDPGRVQWVVGSVDFSPDGSRLVASGIEMIAMWDVASGQSVLSIPQGDCERVAFTADGRRLVASASGKVLVYDAPP